MAVKGKVQAAFKLTQNQHERDYAGIIIEQLKVREKWKWLMR